VCDETLNPKPKCLKRENPMAGFGCLLQPPIVAPRHVHCTRLLLVQCQLCCTRKVEQGSNTCAAALAMADLPRGAL